jgi:hypothetical protein
VAQDVLEEDLQGDRRSTEIDPPAESGEPVEVRETAAERGSGAEWIVAWRGSALTEAG